MARTGQGSGSEEPGRGSLTSDVCLAASRPVTMLTTRSAPALTVLRQP